MKNGIYAIVLLILTSTLFTNCTDSTNSEENNAKLSVYLTDAGAPYDSVIIVFSEISAHIDSEWIQILHDPVNIDLLQYQNNHDTTDFLDQMLLQNLIPKITQPTRIGQTSATLIDHIFTDIDNSQCLAGTFTTDITDHFSNFIVIDKKHLQKSPPHTTIYRSMTDQQINNLNTSLRKL